MPHFFAHATLLDARSFVPDRALGLALVLAGASAAAAAIELALRAAGGAGAPATLRPALAEPLGLVTRLCAAAGSATNFAWPGFRDSN